MNWFSKTPEVITTVNLPTNDSSTPPATDVDAKTDALRTILTKDLNAVKNGVVKVEVPRAAFAKWLFGAKYEKVNALEYLIDNATDDVVNKLKDNDPTAASNLDALAKTYRRGIELRQSHIFHWIKSSEYERYTHADTIITNIFINSAPQTSSSNSASSGRSSTLTNRASLIVPSATPAESSIQGSNESLIASPGTNASVPSAPITFKSLVDMSKSTPDKDFYNDIDKFFKSATDNDQSNFVSDYNNYLKVEGRNGNLIRDMGIFLLARDLNRKSSESSLASSTPHSASPATSESSVNVGSGPPSPAQSTQGRSADPLALGENEGVQETHSRNITTAGVVNDISQRTIFRSIAEDETHLFGRTISSPNDSNLHSSGLGSSSSTSSDNSKGVETTNSEPDMKVSHGGTKKTKKKISEAKVGGATTKTEPNQAVQQLKMKIVKDLVLLRGKNGELKLDLNADKELVQRTINGWAQEIKDLKNLNEADQEEIKLLLKELDGALVSYIQNNEAFVPENNLIFLSRTQADVDKSKTEYLNGLSSFTTLYGRYFSDENFFIEDRVKVPVLGRYQLVEDMSPEAANKQIQTTLNWVESKKGILSSTELEDALKAIEKAVEVYADKGNSFKSELLFFGTDSETKMVLKAAFIKDAKEKIAAVRKEPKIEGDVVKDSKTTQRNEGGVENKKGVYQFREFIRQLESIDSNTNLLDGGVQEDVEKIKSEATTYIQAMSEGEEKNKFIEELVKAMKETVGKCYPEDEKGAALAQCDTFLEILKTPQKK